MNQSKKLLSLFLAFIMVVTLLPLNIFAEGNNETVKELPVTIEDGDSVVELATVVQRNTKTRVKSRSKRDLGFGATISGTPLTGAPSSTNTIQQKIRIKVIAKGLGDQPFDWTSVGKDKTFDATISVKDIATGKTYEIENVEFGESNVQDEKIVYLEIPENLGNTKITAKVKGFDKDLSLRVFKRSDGTTGANQGDLTFEFEIQQIVNPIIKIKVRNPYKEDKPGETINGALKVKLKLAEEYEFEIPASKSEYNIRENDLFKGRKVRKLSENGDSQTLSFLNEVDAKGVFTVDTDKYKIVEAKYDQNTGGELLFETRPIVMQPPRAKTGKPYVVPEEAGYVRVTFDPTTDGKIQGPYAPGDKVFYDVLKNTTWNEAINPDVKLLPILTPTAGYFGTENKNFITWENTKKFDIRNRKNTEAITGATTYTAVFEKDIIPVNPKEPAKPFNPNNNKDENNDRKTYDGKQVRIIFDAGEGNFGKYAAPNEKVEIKKIAFDVKNDLTWKDFKSNVPAEEKITAPDNKVFKGWKPELQKDNDTVVANIYTAQYEAKKAAELIKEAGGLEGKDFGVFVGTDVNAEKFWNKGVQLAASIREKLAIEDATATEEQKKEKVAAQALQALLDAAKVEDTTTPARTTDTEVLNPTNGTLKVTFADNSVYEVTPAQGQTPANTNIEQKLYVYAKDGAETPTDEKLIPEDAVKVAFEKDGQGFKNTVEWNKTYIVKENEALKDGLFPTVTAADLEEGYKTDITWTPVKTTAVTKSGDHYTAATNTFLFKGKVSKTTAAEQIKAAGGLEGKDFGVFVGTDVNAEKFWNKGVQLAASIREKLAIEDATATEEQKKEKAAAQALQALLDAAKVEDTTTPARTTDTEVLNPTNGTLKVTFADNSVYEVTPAQGQTPANTNIEQKLYVYAKDGAETPTDEKLIPEDAVKVAFEKDGQGFKNTVEWNKTYIVKENEALKDGLFPTVTAADLEEGYKTDITWTPVKTTAVTKSGDHYTAATNTFLFKGKVSKTTAAEQIKAAGGLEGKDFGVFVGTDVNAEKFWNKGVQLAASIREKLAIEDATATEEQKKEKAAAQALQALLDAAKVEDTTTPARTTDTEVLNPTNGTLKVTFADNSVYEVTPAQGQTPANTNIEQKLYVYAKDGAETPTDEKLIPEDAVKVAFEKDGQGFKNTVEWNKTYIVKENEALKDGLFPTVTAADLEEGYKTDITWTPVKTTAVTKSGDHYTAATNTFLFKGKVSKTTAAEQIKAAGGLEGKDFGVFVGTDVNAEKFWNKGVQLAASIREKLAIEDATATEEQKKEKVAAQALQALLDAAKVEDTTTPARTTDTEVLNPTNGTLKVTFADNSVYEVTPAQGQTPANTNIEQKLYVYAKDGAETPTDEKLIPEDAVKVAFEKDGQGFKNTVEWNKTYIVKENEALKDGLFPTVTAADLEEGYKTDITWTPVKTTAVTKSGDHYTAATNTFLFKGKVSKTTAAEQIKAAGGLEGKDFGVFVGTDVNAEKFWNKGVQLAASIREKLAIEDATATEEQKKEKVAAQALQALLDAAKVEDTTTPARTTDTEVLNPTNGTLKVTFADNSVYEVTPAQGQTPANTNIEQKLYVYAKDGAETPTDEKLIPEDAVKVAFEKDGQGFKNTVEWNKTYIVKENEALKDGLFPTVTAADLEEGYKTDITWTPVKTTAVTKSGDHYTAATNTFLFKGKVSKTTAAEQIKAAGGLEGKDFGVFVGTDVNAEKFWNKGVQLAASIREKLAIEDATATEEQKKEKAAAQALQALLDAAKVEDTTTPARTTDTEVLNPTNGTLKVTFADNSVYEVTPAQGQTPANTNIEQKLYVYAKDGAETPTDEKLIPEDAVKVAFEKDGQGFKNTVEWNKTYIVKENEALKDGLFPTVTAADLEEGYKTDITWTPVKTTAVTKSGDHYTAATNTFLFKGKVSKTTAAEQIKAAGGLEGKDFGVFVGTDVNAEKFWNKGVQLAASIREKLAIEDATATEEQKKEKAAAQALQALLDAAKVEDTTTPARTTDTEVLNPTNGTLKVTFADNSVYEVTPAQGQTPANTNIEQKLYVYAKDGAETPTDEKLIPEDAVKVAFEKDGQGFKNTVEWNKTYIVKENEALKDGLFPTVTAADLEEGYKTDITWTPVKTTAVTKSGDHYTAATNTFLFKGKVSKTTAAEQIKAAGGLEGKDFGVFVGTDVNAEKFWNKGVQLAASIREKLAIEDATATEEQKKEKAAAQALQALLDAAKVEDTTTPARTTDTEVLNPTNGTLKVTFADNSVYEVTPAQGQTPANTNIEQKLYVYAKDGAETPTDEKLIPEDAVKVAFEKDGQGFKNTVEWNKTYIVKENEALKDGLFPTVTAADLEEGYKTDITWTPVKTTAVTKSGDHYTAATNTFLFKGKVSTDPTATYKNPTIEKGKSETVTPEVKDKDGNTVDKDKVKKPTITNENELPKDLKVTPDNEGKITITVPEDYNGPRKVEIKVKVPVDGITEPIETTITVTITDKYVPVPEKSHEPIIDLIYDSDEVVTGEGEPGAKVIVEFPDGEKVEVPVDPYGRWIVPVPYPLYEDDIVRARQIENGKTQSDWVSQRVRYDEDFWRDRRDRRDKEEKEVKKPVEPKKVWTPDALNARDHFSYIKGYGNNMFAPNRTITRAEVAMIFARLSINQSTVGAPQFKDVKAGDWYKTAVDIMARQGVIKGYEDGTFRPNQPITRREFAAIAARYAGNIDAWKTFRDVPPTDWAYTLINRVAGAGWINGYEDGTFRPNNNITRAEVVAIVNRMLNRKADKKYVDNNLMRAKDAFVDNMRSAWYFYDIYEAAIGHSYERQSNGIDEKWNRVNGQAFEIRER